MEDFTRNQLILFVILVITVCTFLSKDMLGWAFFSLVGLISIVFFCIKKTNIDGDKIKI